MTPVSHWAPVARFVRLVGSLVRTLALAIVIFSLGFGYYIFEVSRLANAPSSKADAIVVLTGGQARIETALKLLQNGQAKRLLISGVHRESSSADIQRITGGQRSLFDCCIDIDKAALDTVGNAEQAAVWAAQYGFDSIIVVTSDYHMPRSLIEFRRKLPAATITPQVAKTTTSTVERLGHDPAAFRIFFAEYLKYVAAVARLSVREKTARTAFASAVAF
jgi:uncharacterized SAM-binding protein YcdF (DUF218 family)